MRAFLVVLLLLGATVFIIQNTADVTVTFLTYVFTIPRALLLAITLACGIFIGILSVAGKGKG